MAQGVGREEFADLVTRIQRLEAASLDVHRQPTALDLASSAAATYPGSGGVLHGGEVRLPDGRQAVWQLAHSLDDLLGEDWEDAEAGLRALGHKHRLALLRDLLREPMTALQLEETGRHGTTGQIYNHVRQLVDAGWLSSERRGVYGVPIARVVPLLVILSAVRGDS